MPTKRALLLLAVLVPFAALTLLALNQHGYLGLWELPLQDWGTRQLFADLTIGMLLISAWMLRDSRSSGVPAWPYIAIIVAAGSFGPLLYLLHREWRRVRAPAGAERG